MQAALGTTALRTRQVRRFQVRHAFTYTSLRPTNQHPSSSPSSARTRTPPTSPDSGKPVSPSARQPTGLAPRTPKNQSLTDVTSIAKAHLLNTLFPGRSAQHASPRIRRTVLHVRFRGRSYFRTHNSSSGLTVRVRVAPGHTRENRTRRSKERTSPSPSARNARGTRSTPMPRGAHAVQATASAES